MELIFTLNNYKKNPVNNIPDGIYNGNWHSSGSFADAYPEIELYPEWASRSMIVPRATIWVFKPHVLFIEGEGRPLEFPITLGFSGDGKLLTVDGGTDFVQFLPQNLEDYSGMNPETKKSCFIIEVDLPFGGGGAYQDRTNQRKIENY